MGVCTGCHSWSTENDIAGLENKFNWQLASKVWKVMASWDFHSCVKCALLNFTLKNFKEVSDTVAGLIHLGWTMSGPHLYGRRHSSESVWSRLDLSGLHPPNKL